MIVYKSNKEGQAIDENDNLIDNPDRKPRLFNGREVVEFDTQEELNEYLGISEENDRLETYVFNIKQLHTELFKKIYFSLDYVNWAELNSAVYSKYREEAQSVLKWYWDTWDIVEQYIKTPDLTITEQDFINSLPKFNL